MFSKTTISVCLTLLSTIAAMEVKLPQSGHTINYVKNGNSENTVLLLTGTLCCIEQGSFKSLIELLGQTNTVMQMDLPGFGNSTPQRRDYSSNFYENDANVVIEFMQKLGVNKYTVLGFGYGANVALYVAAKKPEAVKKIIVWGAKAKITNDVLNIAKTLRDLGKWKSDVRDAMLKIYNEAYIVKVMNDIADGFQRIRNQDGEEFCRETLKSVHAKTIVLHGDDNKHVPKEHAQYIANTVPNGSLTIINDAAHELHHSPSFNSIVQDLLSEDQ